MWPLAALRLGKVLVGLALWGAVSLAALAQAVLPVPPLSGRVIDETGSLTGVASEALATSLAAIETQRGSQVVVLIVATTQPEDIAAYAQRVGDTWKIGRRGVGDGLLIVVVKDDRRVRIEVSKALEGAIPDLMAKRLINEQIVPELRAGNFFAGLNSAVIRIDQLIAGEGWPALPAPPTPSTERLPRSNLKKELAVALAVGLGLALTLWVGSKMPHPAPRVTARRRRDENGDDDDSDSGQWTRDNNSGSSAGSSSSYGGSFSSGGGGDFGGGGASGKW